MITFKEYTVLVTEASYVGNIGLMELIKFYKVADPKKVEKVKGLIAAKKNKEAWDIIQKTLGVKLDPSAFA
jgi:uncharacterized protein YrzB (UPF0473 family)